MSDGARHVHRAGKGAAAVGIDATRVVARLA
jgi:hypothetical protein